jgi:hypothetical protein
LPANALVLALVPVRYPKKKTPPSGGRERGLVAASSEGCVGAIEALDAYLPR